ncbi:hypothetical protein STREPTOSP366_67720 [Streptomyces variabilis]
MEHLSVSVYRVPTNLPGGDATLAWDAITLVLVEVTAAGHTGLGWTYGSAATAPVVRDELSGLVTGHDAFDVPAAGDRMSRAVRNTGRPGIAAGAISAVDTALWDLKARLLGLPLVRLLGSARPVPRSRCTAAAASPRTTTPSSNGNCAGGASRASTE